MAWCTDVLAVYLPQIQESDFLQIVQQLLFLKGPDVCRVVLTACIRVHIPSFVF